MSPCLFIRLPSFVAVAAVTFAALLGALPARAEVRRAVLVGIDKYVPNALSPAATVDSSAASRANRRGWSDLDGAVNDVVAMRQGLLKPAVRDHCGICSI